MNCYIIRGELPATSWRDVGGDWSAVCGDGVLRSDITEI